jgi:hypothetical protein
MRASSIVVLLVLAACGKKDDQAMVDSAAAASDSSATPAPTFTLADFGHLRYLEGTWRGTMANGNPFYESYHFLNDSTIQKGNHTDSTFQTKSDSSLIMIRNGKVADVGAGSAYTAVKLDASVVDFRASDQYHFTWTREGNDTWTARLFSKKPDGSEQVTVYPMKRMAPAPPTAK